MRSTSNDDIIVRRFGRQPRDIRGVELAVAVSQHRPRLGAGADSRDDRSAIATVGTVMYDLNVGIGCG